MAASSTPAAPKTPSRRRTELERQEPATLADEMLVHRPHVEDERLRDRRRAACAEASPRKSAGSRVSPHEQRGPSEGRSAPTAGRPSAAAIPRRTGTSHSARRQRPRRGSPLHDEGAANGHSGSARSGWRVFRLTIATCSALSSSRSSNVRPSRIGMRAGREVVRVDRRATRPWRLLAGPWWLAHRARRVHPR